MPALKCRDDDLSGPVTAASSHSTVYRDNCSGLCPGMLAPGQRRGADWSNFGVLGNGKRIFDVDSEVSEPYS